MSEQLDDLDQKEIQAELPLDQKDLPKWQARIRNLVESRWFFLLVLALICLNAIILGAETLPFFLPVRELLVELDHILLYIFVFEIGMRIFAYRGEFFKNGWNVFDLSIVLISALSLSNVFAAMRAFRVLRVLHFISIVPRLRTVVRALFESIPGILSVGLIGVLIIYIFAVIASNLFGAEFPHLFGDVFISMYTLFQVMTLEGWNDIAAQVIDVYSMAWIFFVVFILIGTFTMLNLFVAIVVRVVEEDSNETEEILHEEHDELRQDIAALQQEMRGLNETIKQQNAQLHDRDMALQELVKGLERRESKD